LRLHEILKASSCLILPENLRAFKNVYLFSKYKFKKTFVKSTKQTNFRMGKVTPWLAAVAPEKENRFRNKRKGNFNKKPKIKKWEKEDQIIKEKVARYNETFEPDVPFAGYPLSPQTQRGLRRYLPEECTPTRIQQETIMLALQGNGKSEFFY
jgi:hypothetical protein